MLTSDTRGGRKQLKEALIQHSLENGRGTPVFVTLNLWPGAPIAAYRDRLQRLDARVSRHLLGRGWARQENTSRRIFGIFFMERTPGESYYHCHALLWVPPGISVDDAIYAIESSWDPWTKRVPGRKTPKIANSKRDRPELMVERVRDTARDLRNVLGYSSKETGESSETYDHWDFYGPPSITRG